MEKKQIAPKDPVAKRPFFYLLQEKEIFAAPQPQGRGIQFFYLDSGRMTDSAKITGNVQEEKMLGLLESARGFRKLVHSIGVSVMAKETEQKVDFVFQMYGEKDPYNSGTSIRHTLKCDGMPN